MPDTNTEFLVDHANVTVFWMWTVCFDRLHWASFHTGGILTLAARCHKNIVGPVRKRILLDLDA